MNNALLGGGCKFACTRLKFEKEKDVTHFSVKFNYFSVETTFHVSSPQKSPLKEQPLHLKPK